MLTIILNRDLEIFSNNKKNQNPVFPYNIEYYRMYSGNGKCIFFIECHPEVAEILVFMRIWDNFQHKMKFLLNLDVLSGGYLFF